jgi:hypothetical protein
MRTPAFLFASFVILLCAMPARGQSAFVGGGAASNSIWFAHSESTSPVITNSDTSGRTTDWFVTGGGVVARHAVLQAELSFGSKLSTEIPSSRYVPGYPTTPTGTQTQEYTYQFKHGAVLGGYTTGSSRRVRLAALAGVAFMQTIRHSYSLYSPPTPNPYSVFPSEDTTITYSIAPVFGLDVPIQAAPHLVLVPQVRAWKIASGGPLSVSFGAGARVTF